MTGARTKRQAAPKPTVTPESEVLAQILQGLAVLGIEAQRQNTGMAMGANGRAVRFGRKGNADVSATIGHGPNAGKRLEIEVKRKGGKPSPAQWDRINRVNAAGGLSFWTDDSAECFRVLGRLLEGWHVETDAGGNQWVTDAREGDTNAS